MDEDTECFFPPNGVKYSPKNLLLLLLVLLLLSCCLYPGNLLPCFISCSFEARLLDDLVMGVLLAGTRREASVVTLSRDHDIWLLFTINTYLMPPPPSPEPHLSLCVQDFGKSGLVSPDWFRPPAKCLYLMRVGNPDKCSIIRGNRKTRWISAEDLLCVNTKIYHPTKRGKLFCFPFHFETFS